MLRDCQYYIYSRLIGADQRIAILVSLNRYRLASRWAAAAFRGPSRAFRVPSRWVLGWPTVVSRWAAAKHRESIGCSAVLKPYGLAIQKSILDKILTRDFVDIQSWFTLNVNQFL